MLKNLKKVNVANIFTVVTRLGMPGREFKGYPRGYGRRGRKAAIGLRRATARYQARTGYRTGVYARAYPNDRTGGFLGIENKFVDGEETATALSGTWAPIEDGTTLALPIPAVGNTESTRIGRVYSINSLHIRFQITTIAAEALSAPLDDVHCRVVVVWDTQTNGAQLTATDVMDGGQTLDVLSFRNLQFSKRFRVLMDKTIILNMNNQVNEGAVNAFAAGGKKVRWNFNKKFRTPVKVICSGTTGVVGSVTDNSFHVIGVATNTLGLLEYQARIRFSG